MMMLKNNVIVQIVTHNSARTIFQCLHSVFQQHFQQIQVIVIDNASTDHTKKILRRFPVERVLLEKNIGYAAGHNLALQRIKGDYVMTLNPDVALSPTCVEALVSAMDQAETHAGSAQPLLFRVNTMSKHSTVVDSCGLVMSRHRRQMLRFEGQNFVNKRLKATNIFGPDGAAAFYRRAMLEDIDIGNGVFDEDFFMHKEDVDLAWRAQLKGWTSLFVPDAVGYHIRTFRAGQRARVSTRLRMIAVRNRYYLMIKNEIPLLFFKDLLWIFIYDLGIFFYLVLREPRSISAYRQLFLTIPSLLKKRRAIQSSCRVTTQYMSQWFRWRRT